ncbi:hypothetical protein ABT56_09865 [Photobacterium aquae]|uniref:Type II secretion system protein K n=1 Tax=Photobacterium aquae TaxID=1195763 RepID=A0A0J1H1Z6_9GAMM|nr:type II secretion system protein GspK [Photobacterium aquae]KLV05835.1 hypothetical protein ABT56_09865 [Photobacterium aquae]
MKKEKGAILPLTLIVMAILSVLAMGVMAKARSAIEEVADKKQEFSDFLSVSDAVQEIVFVLSTGTPEPGRFMLEGKSVPVDGSLFNIDGVEASVQDNAGLISLALASQENLFRLFRLYVEPSEASDWASIVNEWRKPGGFGRMPTMGDDDEVLPRNSFMRGVDELLEISVIAQSGVFNTGNEKVPHGLRDYLVVGGVGWQNYASMPAELLAGVFGVSESQLEKLVEAREKGEWQQFAQLQRAAGLFDEMGSVASNRFLIRLHGKAFSARTMVEVAAGGLPLYKRTLWQYPDAARY